jgi:tetratricopeptide (TPR) repeat protein
MPNDTTRQPFVDHARRHPGRGSAGNTLPVRREITRQAIDSSDLPNTADAQCDLGNAFRASGQLDQAIAAYSRALQFEPGSSEVLNNLGDALRARGRVGEALIACRKAIQGRPDFAEAYNNLGNVLRDMGKFDESIAAYTRAAQLRPEMHSIHNNLGIVLRIQGRLDEAASEYERAIGLNPDYAKAHSNLGSVLRETGRPEEAVRSCERAIELRPNFAQAHYNLARALATSERWAEAVAAYEATIELEPTHSGAHHHLGDAFQKTGQLQNAIASYWRAIELDPADATTYCNLGHALKDSGQVDEAILAYGKAIELKPDRVDPYFNLGNALRDKGRFDEAIDAYRQALVLRPGVATIHNHLGVALTHLGQLDEAIESFSTAVHLKPDYAKAHNNLGTALRDQGRLEESVVACQTATDLKPDYGMAFYNLAKALKDLGRLDEAITAYSHATRLQPDFAEAFNNLGNILKDRGELDDAIAAYSRAIALKPHLAGAQTNLDAALREQELPAEIIPESDFAVAEPDPVEQPATDMIDASVSVDSLATSHVLSEVQEAEASVTSSPDSLLEEPLTDGEVITGSLVPIEAIVSLSEISPALAALPDLIDEMPDLPEVSAPISHEHHEAASDTAPSEAVSVPLAVMGDDDAQGALAQETPDAVTIAGSLNDDERSHAELLERQIPACPSRESQESADSARDERVSDVAQGGNQIAPGIEDADIQRSIAHGDLAPVADAVSSTENPAAPAESPELDDARPFLLDDYMPVLHEQNVAATHGESLEWPSAPEAVSAPPEDIEVLSHVAEIAADVEVLSEQLTAGEAALPTVASVPNVAVSDSTEAPSIESNSPDVLDEMPVLPEVEVAAADANTLELPASEITETSVDETLAETALPIDGIAHAEFLDHAKAAEDFHGELLARSSDAYTAFSQEEATQGDSVVDAETLEVPEPSAADRLPAPEANPIPEATTFESEELPEVREQIESEPAELEISKPPSDEDPNGFVGSASANEMIATPTAVPTQSIPSAEADPTNCATFLPEEATLVDRVVDAGTSEVPEPSAADRWPAPEASPIPEATTSESEELAEVRGEIEPEPAAPVISQSTYPITLQEDPNAFVWSASADEIVGISTDISTYTIPSAEADPTHYSITAETAAMTEATTSDSEELAKVGGEFESGPTEPAISQPRSAITRDADSNTYVGSASADEIVAISGHVSIQTIPSAEADPTNFFGEMAPHIDGAVDAGALGVSERSTVDCAAAPETIAIQEATPSAPEELLEVFEEAEPQAAEPLTSTVQDAFVEPETSNEIPAVGSASADEIVGNSADMSSQTIPSAEADRTNLIEDETHVDGAVHASVFGVAEPLIVAEELLEVFEQAELPPPEPVTSTVQDAFVEPEASDDTASHSHNDSTVTVTAPADVIVNQEVISVAEPIAAPAEQPPPVPPELPTPVRARRVRRSALPRAIGRFDSPAMPRFIDHEVVAENPRAAEEEREVANANIVAERPPSTPSDASAMAATASTVPNVFAVDTAISGDRTLLKSFLELQTEMSNPFATEPVGDVGSVAPNESPPKKSLPAPSGPATAPTEADASVTAIADSQLGDAFRAEGPLEEAIASYRKALALRPDLPEAYSNLGSALQEAQQSAEAVTVYRQAVSLWPSDADLHFSLGEALQKNGQLEEAIASYRQAVALRPDFAEAYFNLGNALRDLRNKEA